MVTVMWKFPAVGQLWFERTIQELFESWKKWGYNNQSVNQKIWSSWCLWSRGDGVGGDYEKVHVWESPEAERLIRLHLCSQFCCCWRGFWAGLGERKTWCIHPSGIKVLLISAPLFSLFYPLGSCQPWQWLMRNWGHNGGVLSWSSLHRHCIHSSFLLSLIFCLPSFLLRLRRFQEADLSSKGWTGAIISSSDARRLGHEAFTSLAENWHSFCRTV